MIRSGYKKKREIKLELDPKSTCNLLSLAEKLLNFKDENLYRTDVLEEYYQSLYQAFLQPHLHLEKEIFLGKIQPFFNELKKDSKEYFNLFLGNLVKNSFSSTRFFTAGRKSKTCQMLRENLFNFKKEKSNNKGEPEKEMLLSPIQFSIDENEKEKLQGVMLELIENLKRKDRLDTGKRVEALHTFFYLIKQYMLERKLGAEGIAVLIGPCLAEAFSLKGKFGSTEAQLFKCFAEASLLLKLFETPYDPFAYKAFSSKEEILIFTKNPIYSRHEQTKMEDSEVESELESKKNEKKETGETWSTKFT